MEINFMLDTLGKWLTKDYIANPILVVGAGRSGTSILLQALGEHSQILSSDRESPFIPYLGFLLNPFEFRVNKKYHRESLNLPISYLYENLCRLSLESAMGRHYGLNRLRRFQRFSALKTRHWCVKTYPNQDETKGLSILFPNIKLIYIYRNGMSVVNSRSRFQGMSHYRFNEHCEIWAKHVEKYTYLLKCENAFCVRHEDLVDDPDRIFRDILSFVGLDYEEGPASFAKSTLIHSLDKRTQTDVAVQDILKKRTPVYELWTAEQMAVFKDICSEGMQKMGYEVPY
jgi:hypothetical protein